MRFLRKIISAVTDLLAYGTLQINLVHSSSSVPGESVHVMARGFLPMVRLCAGWGPFLLSDLIVIITIIIFRSL